MALEKLLTSPGDEYYPVPWWAWTGKLEPDLMRKQLRLMREQGVHEFFIFPIYGMVPEYMSSDYVERIGWTLEWCKELGMKVWVYDELNWPSGTAAGLVARKHPEAIAANLILEVQPASQVNLDEIKRDPAVIHAVKIGDQAAVYRRMKDQTINITVKGCLWTRNDPGMLDMLSKSAVAAFIEEAYEPIAKHFPQELGKTIKGFFTDEPSIAPGHIPWTDGLAERFKAEFGYDLIPVLHDLNFDSPTALRTRSDYWRLVTEMSSEAYTGQLAQWCEEHGLVLTGHMVWEEDSHSVWYQGDSPTHQMKMQVPGCDLLQTPTNFDDNPGWYTTGNASLAKIPKDPASAARYMGRKRVMCEAYGVMPWYKTMVDEKRLTDWLVALGVNLINDNSLITDISGFRKRAISGKHFTQPWWPQAHLYYDYAARICALSAETTLDAQVAVLYPTTTWWSLTVRTQEPSPELRALEVTFDNTVDALVKSHWDFEMLFEQVLADADVRNGMLVTTGGQFACVVVAGITRLPADAAAKLEQFDASGGTVVLVDSDVTVVDGPNTRPIDLPNAVCVTASPDSFQSELDAALSDKLSRPWLIECPESHGVISAARIDSEGRRMLFLANMTPGDKELSIRWNGNEQVELWDADSTQRWAPVTGCKCDKNGSERATGKCTLTLPDGQSVWLVQTREPTAQTVPPPHFISLKDAQPTVELKGPWTFWTDRPNTYKLNFRLLPDPDGSIEFGSSKLASDAGWIDLVDDDAGIPLGSDSLKRYWLKSEFKLARAMPTLQIIGDSEDVEKVYVNGVDLGESAQQKVWDDENRAWDVKGAAQVGSNEVLMLVRASDYNSERIAIFSRSIVEPAVVMGWFAVDPKTGVLTQMPDEVELGDIRMQGFPHFAGTCTYQTDFAWPGPEGPVLILCDAGRDVVEVAIDGHGLSLGKRAWARKAFLIENLPQGMHRIVVRTTNTLGAILTRTYNAELTPNIPPSGLLGPVRLYISRAA